MRLRLAAAVLSLLAVTPSLGACSFGPDEAAARTLPTPAATAGMPGTSTPPASTQPASATPRPQVLIQAHQGGGLLAPPNSAKAFRKMAALDFHMVEFDVQITSDGIAVINHSDRIMDMPGRSCSHDGLWIHRQPYAVVKTIRCAGEPLPKLSEVLTIFRDTKYRLNVEIKAWDNHGTQPASSLRDYTRRIMRQVERAGYRDRYIVSAFDWRILMSTIRQIHPGIYVIALERSSKVRQPTTKMYESVRDAAAMGANAFETDLPVTQENLLTFIREQGMEPQIWYANTPADVRLALAHGISPISSDDPVMTRKVIASARGRELIDRGTVRSVGPRVVFDQRLPAGAVRSVDLIGGAGPLPTSAQDRLAAVLLDAKITGSGKGVVRLRPRNGPRSSWVTAKIPDGTTTATLRVLPGDFGDLTVETSGAARVNLTVSGYIRASYQLNR